MKKKCIKLFILLISIVFVSGCFKYYIPRGLSVSYKTDFNEIIKSKNYDYYLYVDLISYYNKVQVKYEKDESIYYSYLIDDKGILNITKKDERYLIHLEYNYARMEVLVKEKDINMAVSNALIITSSILYNDDTVKAMFDEGVLSTNEKPISVFKNQDENSRNLLELDEEIYQYEEKDRDYIK